VKDFTLKTYRLYLGELLRNNYSFLRFDEYIGNSNLPSVYCLVRHDVDRLPQRALDMAKVEKEMGVKSTYYFRIKDSSFDPQIMKQIADLGHEIGYHYESLSDTNGDIPLAVKDFEGNLKKYRELAAIKTCSMHGRPFKPFDNRDIWRNKENHEYLKNKLEMLGEVYLDIDYSDIAYINDTGRNWTSGKSNRRDKVNSTIKADFNSGEELLDYFKGQPHKKICFQIHPERWTDSNSGWMVQWAKDSMINAIKFGLNIVFYGKK
jgi:hypothetical protein